MEDSILISIKKLLGISGNDDSFDTDIIMHINSVFSKLSQLWTRSASFRITGDTETWSNYLGNYQNLDMIESYVYLKVKMVFDPPSSSVVADSINKTITELEWSISVANDANRAASES